MDGVEIASVLAGSLVLLGLFFLPIAYKNKGREATNLERNSLQ